MAYLFVKFLKDNRGATAVEYGLIAALLSVVIIVSLGKTGTKLSGKFSAVAGNL